VFFIVQIENLSIISVSSLLELMTLNAPGPTNQADFLPDFFLVRSCVFYSLVNVGYSFLLWPSPDPRADMPNLPVVVTFIWSCHGND